MTDTPIKRKRGRPSNAEKAERERIANEALNRAKASAARASNEIDDLLGTNDDADDLIGKSMDSMHHEQDAIPNEETDNNNVFAGVSVTWLSNVFRMAPETVKKRLAECPIKGKRRNYALYDLAQAAQYLVPPKVDIAAYIKAMRPNDLPPMLQDSYWSAMRKRQEYQIRAKELWPTDDVLNVLGELSMRIKSSVQLWVENIDRKHSISGEIRQMITEQSDNLLDEIYKIMVEAPEKSRTPSSFEEFEEPSEAAAPDAGADDGV